MTLFPILIMVEESAVGRALRLLHHTEGVAEIKPMLDQITAPRGAKNGSARKPPSEQPSPPPHSDRPRQQDIIIAALVSGAKNREFLKQEIVRYGHNKSGVHVTLSGMKERQIIAEVGSGLYDLTEEARAKINANLQQAQPVAPTAQSLPAPVTKPKRGESSLVVVDLMLGLPQHRATAAQIKAKSAQHRMNGGNLIKRMVDHKLIRRVDAGVYELTAQGQKLRAHKEGT